MHPKPESHLLRRFLVGSWRLLNRGVAYALAVIAPQPPEKAGAKSNKGEAEHGVPPPEGDPVKACAASNRRTVQNRCRTRAISFGLKQNFQTNNQASCTSLLLDAYYVSGNL